MRTNEWVLRAINLFESLIADWIINDMATEPECKYCFRRGTWTENGGAICDHYEDCILMKLIMILNAR